MGMQVSPRPLSANWRLLCGVIIAVAALKELAHVAVSRLGFVVKRPSFVGTMIIGGLLRDAFGGIGRNVIGR